MPSPCQLTVTVRCNGVERILTGRRAIIVRELMGERLRVDEIEYGQLVIDFGNRGEVKFNTTRYFPGIKE